MENGVTSTSDLLTRIGVQMGTCPSSQKTNLAIFLASEAKTGFNPTRLKIWEDFRDQWIDRKVQLVVIRPQVRMKGNPERLLGQFGVVVGVGGPSSGSTAHHARCENSRWMGCPRKTLTPVVGNRKLDFRLTVKLDLGGLVTMASFQVRKHISPPPFVYKEEEVDF